MFFLKSNTIKSMFNPNFIFPTLSHYHGIRFVTTVAFKKLENFPKATATHCAFADRSTVYVIPPTSFMKAQIHSIKAPTFKWNSIKVNKLPNSAKVIYPNVQGNSKALILGKSEVLRRHCTFSYDLITQQTTKVPFKTPLDYYEMCSVGNTIYMIGETYNSNNSRLGCQVYTLDITSDLSTCKEITTTGDIPFQTRGIRLIPYGKYIYLFTLTSSYDSSGMGGMGGVDYRNEDDSRFVRVHILDTKTNKWIEIATKGQSPIKRSGCGVGLLRADENNKTSDKVVFFGGIEFPGNVISRKFTDIVDIFDIHTSTWEIAQVQGSAPSPRSNHTFTPIPYGTEKFGSRALIVGGKSEWTTYNDVYEMQILK
eukprot:TRINITY_DN11823_c0_g1_i2.p1 TRINITY_DN11823_c0_g1~~TRINITY_DN11823_c0_g1_i2.p1  ORF type:complete len:368 (+),score=44.26 TRINITY_DN11823_c0_g1_i2:178-1281(+)